MVLLDADIVSLNRQLKCKGLPFKPGEVADNSAPWPRTTEALGMRACRAAATSALDPAVHSWFWLIYTNGASGRGDVAFLLALHLAMTS